MVAENAVFTMAQKDQIPAFTMRWQRWFKHDDVDRWINEQKTVVTGNIEKDTLNV